MQKTLVKTLIWDSSKTFHLDSKFDRHAEQRNFKKLLKKVVPFNSSFANVALRFYLKQDIFDV